MKRAGATLAALVVAGIAVAGGFGVGSGGLQGAPSGGVGSGSTLGPGCVVTATGINCFGIDAGHVNVQSGFSVGAVLNVGAVVDVGTDLTVSGNNDFTANRQARVNGDLLFGGSKAVTNTTPTVTACTGAAVTLNNASAMVVFDVGTGCAGSTATLTFEAAPTGYVCQCSTTTADRMVQQKVMPASTTQVTLQNITISTGGNSNFADGADVACICIGG